MRADVEILVLPYSSAAGGSLLDHLIREFRDGGWTDFKGAIAFAKASGNFPDLLTAVEQFTEDGTRRVALTFGADVFGSRARGSDYEAIRSILERFDARPNVTVNLYHERGRTFHPKLYLFSNEADERALVIVGSSNWSEGGLVDNVEANVLIRLHLSDGEHRDCFEELGYYFAKYWSEQNG